MRRVLLAVLLAGLAACHPAADDDARDLAADIAGMQETGTGYGVLHLEGTRPYTGLERRPGEIEELPLHLRASDAVTLSLAGRPQDADLAARIEAATGVRVTLAGERPSGSAPPAVMGSSGALLPEGGIWTGALDDLLDLWCEAAGYAWSWADGTVTVQRQRQVVFRLNALAGSQSIQGATSTSDAAGAEGSNNLARQSLTTETTYDPWPEITEQLKAQLDPSTRVAAAPATASVVVSGLPRDIDRARAYLDWLNRTVLRPVTLTVDVYQVRFHDQASFDLGIEGTFKRIFGSGAGFEAGANLAGIVRPGPATDSLAATVGALHQAGTVARVLSATVPSLNAQPAQFFELFSEAYLKEVRTTIMDGTRSTNLVPGTVSSGFAMTFVAQIVSPHDILIRLFASLQDRPAFTVFETASQKIQLPAYGSRAVQVTQKVSRGETLVVTGFRDRGTLSDRRGTFDADIPFPFGGVTSDASRVEQVLLVTAEAGEPLGIVETSGDEL